MSKTEDWPVFQIPKNLLTNRAVLILLAVLAALEYYNAGVIPALVNREKATEATATADNAKLRQKAEAAIAEQKSLTAAAVAANAAKKQAAEARKANANASKTAAEAETAKYKAGNASVQFDAAAEAQGSEAEIIKQQAVIETEIARQIARKLRVETESKQIGAVTNKILAWFIDKKVNTCLRCDPNDDIWNEGVRVPDLPSGAELPPPEAGEPVQVMPPTPKLEVLVRRFSWEAGSECERRFRNWRVSLAYGAFTAGCDYSAGQRDIETARRVAVNTCARTYSRNCAIVAEITVETPPTPKPPQVVEKQDGITLATATEAGGGLKTYRVISEIVNGKVSLRDGPGKNHTKLDEISAGTTVRQVAPCVNSDDGATTQPWCKLDYNGAVGWVSSSGLEVVTKEVTSPTLTLAATQQQDLNERVHAFLNAYHAAAVKDMRQLAKFYAASVDYGQKGVISRDLIMREKVQVETACPRRAYKILVDNFTVQPAGSNRVDVQFDVDTLCSGGSKESRRVWQSFVTIDFSNGNPVIVAQKGSVRQSD